MQQRTSVLPPSHPVRALQGLARQIALPHEFAPERFPSFPALERTAVMGFNAPSTLSLPASTPVKVMVTRQAAYPSWADQSTQHYMHAASYQYDYARQNLNFSAASSLMSFIGGTVSNMVASGSRPGFTGIGSTPLPYPVMAYDALTGPNPWLWIPPGFAAYTVIGFNTAVPGATTAELTLEVWDSPGETHTVPTTTGTIVSGRLSCIIGFSYTGWIRPRTVSASVPAVTGFGDQMFVTIFTVSGTASFIDSTTTQGTVTVSSSSVTGFIPLMAPAEFANSSLPWYSARTTAASLLGTNVSQVLNKGGTVLAGRVAPQVINPFSVGSSYITTLHPAEKAFLPLETGVYTYAPPSTDLVDFWDYTLPTGGGSSPGPLYRLDNTSLVNVLFITAGSVAETLAVNVDWHIEFRTSSALFPIGLSTVTLETLHQAQIALASVGFFFENPTHSKILHAVTSAVKRYGPSALGLVNPTAGRLAKKAVVMLSAKPHNSMRTTSGQASGITGKPQQQKKKKQKAAPKPKPKKQR